MLSGDSMEHRKQVGALKRYFAKRGCTLLITDDNTADEPETLLHSLAHGVVALTRETGSFGRTRRKLEVVKVRALDFSEGLHDYAIHTGGLTVYPRLIAAAHRARQPQKSFRAVCRPSMLCSAGASIAAQALH